MTEGVRTAACVMCDALARAGSDDSLVVHVGALNFVVMNLYPYNSGHVMVAPRRHVGSLQAATPEELAEMMALARRLEEVAKDVYHPDGANLGMNLGRPAGAGVADHIHLHFVPRWAGDTRVIPEDPREACRRLRPYFA